jgi:hypothetical protein
VNTLATRETPIEPPVLRAAPPRQRR